MAFSNSTSDRMDELRFRSQQSPRNESPSLPLSGMTSPIRNGRLPPPLSTHDGSSSRVSLTRRFTTDSGRVPTITSITTQRSLQAPESHDFIPSVRRIWIPSVASQCDFVLWEDHLIPLSSLFRTIIRNSLTFSKTYHKVQLVSLPLPFLIELRTLDYTLLAVVIRISSHILLRTPTDKLLLCLLGTIHPTSPFFPWTHCSPFDSWRRRNKNTSACGSKSGSLSLRCRCWISSNEEKNKNCSKCRRRLFAHQATTRLRTVISLNRQRPLNIEKLPQAFPQFSLAQIDIPLLA